MFGIRYQYLPHTPDTSRNYRTNAGHIYTLKNGPERYKLSLSVGTKNTKIEKELGVKLIISPPHLLGETSKLRSEIAEPILATFLH
jgi:hypothetical protein